MQSSYSLIKKDFATEGNLKVISTQYVVKNAVFEEIKSVEQDGGQEEQKVQEPQVDTEEIIRQYQELGRRIVEDANNQKQNILVQAEQQAAIAEREAYEKGYSQGNQNGYDDGYKKAYDETIDRAKQEAEEIVSRAEEVLKHAHDDYLKYLESEKEEIIKLSLKIAESIAQKTLSYDDSMNLIVEEAFKISKGEDNVILKANAAHVEELKSQIERWKIAYAIKNEIFVLADHSMEPGNVILEKPSGIVKVGVDIGMEQIRKAILG